MELIEINKYNTQEILINIQNYDGEIDVLNFVVEDALKNIVFKKTLLDGITKQENNKYIVSIEANDTKDTNPLYKYTYYIEILLSGNDVVQTAKKGDFKVGESSTSLKEEIEVNGKNSN